MFDKSSRFLYTRKPRSICSAYSVLVVVVYVNKCANDKMVEHVFALSGNYRGQIILVLLRNSVACTWFGYVERCSWLQ